MLKGDDDDPVSRVDPGALVLKPDDTGKPADQMEWGELQDAIDEQESIVRSATQSTPDIRRRRTRLAELYGAQQKLGSKAAAGAQGKAGARPAKRQRGRKAPPPVMPPKPQTLTRGSVDWTKVPGVVARRELNMVVAYLAANPPKADREILMLELPNIERAAGAARAEKQSARRAEQFTEALSPKSGSDQDKFDEILRRLQHAERDPSQEDIWLIHYGNRVLPLSTEELAAVRDRVGKGLIQAAGKISGLVYDVESAWQERTEHNRSHSRTHRLVRFATGAEDIPRKDIDNMLKTSNFYVGRIRQYAASGKLIEAGDELAVYDRNARYYAEKVGNWESELMRGAGRWVLGLTILKEALSIMAGFGAANLARIAGAGSTIATFKAGAQIASMTTATGLVTGALGAEAAGGDWKQGARAGGGAGFGVGANALTAGIGQIASIGDAAKATTLGGKALAVTKAVGLETGGAVATSSAQAAIEGGDVGDAALGALVATPVSTLGGGFVDKVASNKAASVLGHTAVGVAAGTTSAAATDQDLFTGAVTGGAGALYGGLATHIDGPGPDAGGGTPRPDNEAPPTPAPPGASTTLPGIGFDTRLPAAPADKLGTGIEPRLPAAPADKLGTGIEPRLPAAPATKLGTGIEPRLPAAPALPPGDVAPVEPDDVRVAFRADANEVHHSASDEWHQVQWQDQLKIAGQWTKAMDANPPQAPLAFRMRGGAIQVNDLRWHNMGLKLADINRPSQLGDSHRGGGGIGSADTMPQSPVAGGSPAAGPSPGQGPSGTAVGVAPGPGSPQGPTGTQVGVAPGPGGTAPSASSAGPAGAGGKVRFPLEAPKGPPPPGPPRFNVKPTTPDQVVALFKSDPHLLVVDASPEFHQYVWEVRHWQDGRPTKEPAPLAYEEGGGAIRVDGDRWVAEGGRAEDIVKQGTGVETPPSPFEVAPTLPAAPAGPGATNVSIVPGSRKPPR